MRAMARTLARRDDGEAALVEIKAVDPAAYPSFGALELEPAQPLADTLRTKDGAFGLAADPLLIARLDAKLGESLMIGAARFELRAALRSEPDQLSGGIGFGPRVLMGAEAFRATGLAQPGTIVRYIARVTLPGVASDEDVSRFAKEAEATFPRAGWEIRKRDGVSPQFSRNLERFSQLLTLVALTALVAGGAGVANAVNGLIERKRQAYRDSQSARRPGLARLRHRAGASAVGREPRDSPGARARRLPALGRRERPARTRRPAGRGDARRFRPRDGCALRASRHLGVRARPARARA